MTDKQFLESVSAKTKELRDSTTLPAIAAIGKTKAKETVRKILNAIESDTNKYVSNANNYKSFVGEYNKGVRTVNKAFDFGVKEITKPPNYVVKGNSAKLYAKLISNNVNLTRKVVEKKIDYLDKIGKLTEFKKTPGAFRVPRVTLLKTGAFNDVKGRKININFPKKFENNIQSFVDRSIRQGKAPKAIAKEVGRRIQKLVPSDSFYYRRGRGFYRMSIDRYARGWVADFSAIHQSDGIIASSVITGNNLIEINRTGTTDKLCIPYDGKRFRTHSQPNDNTGVPILSNYPPYHRACRHFASIVTIPIQRARKARDRIINQTKRQREDAIQKIIASKNRKAAKIAA